MWSQKWRCRRPALCHPLPQSWPCTFMDSFLHWIQLSPLVILWCTGLATNGPEMQGRSLKHEPWFHVISTINFQQLMSDHLLSLHHSPNSLHCCALRLLYCHYRTSFPRHVAFHIFNPIYNFYHLRSRKISKEVLTSQLPASHIFNYYLQC